MEGKKNIIADRPSRIAERSIYNHDLPCFEETDAHLAAMQLWRGKALLEKPAIKKKGIQTDVRYDPSNARFQGTRNVPLASVGSPETFGNLR